MDYPPIKYNPTTGKAETIVVPNQESDLVQFNMEIFPKEIYLGDTIYLVSYQKNISDQTINYLENLDDIPIYETLALTTFGTSALASNLTEKKYKWLSEHPNIAQHEYVISGKAIHPNKKRPYGKHCFEFPPLEDLENPFWKALIEKMPPEGITCQLQLEYYYHTKTRGNDLSEYRNVKVVQDIHIKPRPEKEMQLLTKWYKNTPKKLFPKVDRNRKIPHNADLKASAWSNIWIGWRRYDPWMFIRLGNRKPSDPNNPTTIDGWRELEAGLAPSTMRDEIRFTRMQLEYYAAPDEKTSQVAKEAFVDWLKLLPEVQRNVMITSLVANANKFGNTPSNTTHKTPLCEKNVALLKSLYELMDDGDNML